MVPDAGIDPEALPEGELDEAEPLDQPSSDPEAVADEGEGATTGGLARFRLLVPALGEAGATYDDVYVEAEPTAASASVANSGDTDPTDAAEIARQLANLSPKAAKAVAAAAKATTQAEREAALAQVDETQDPINRDLLLKFLGSVNS